MKIDTTSNNFDLNGFDLAAMKDLGAYCDGSGGGIHDLAYQLMRLRETRERIDRLYAFIRKYQHTLARLSWRANVDTLPPLERDDILFVPEIRLCSYVYDKKQVTAMDIARLWPEASWSRSKSAYSCIEDRVRDYTAEIDGVVVRIEEAERAPAPVKVDRCKPCGPIKISDQ